jgi:dimethylglycine dehydrogenase
MLSPEGKLKGDLTVFNWGDGTWWIMGLLPARMAHALVPRPHGRTAFTVRDLGEQMAGFSLAGPKSREVIERLTDGPVGELPFMGCGSSTSG